jgi:hypothetical protein
MDRDANEDGMETGPQIRSLVRTVKIIEVCYRKKPPNAWLA